MKNFNRNNYPQIEGDLYTAVQSSGIFKDSKTFVDSVPKKDPEEILDTYKNEKGDKSFDLKTFVLSNFKLPVDEEKDIKLPENRNMKEHIRLLWNELKREAPADTNKYSTLIPIPRPYIIPGGRFREIYYWDSYFTMHGLLADGEVETVINMIDNFSYLIDEIGFIPNGNRLYYLTRSQPPFFAAMIDLVCRHKRDYNWGLKYLPFLLKEYRFWCGNIKDNISSNHLIKLNDGGYLNRYYDTAETPREESYLEDKHAAENLTPGNKKKLYNNIRTACESGWDFSSRWFADGKNLTSCVCSEILPVDLNSLLYSAELLISKLYDLNNEKSNEKAFRESANERKELINKYFWDQENSFYHDFNFNKNRKTATLSLAACYPLYFKLAEAKMAEGVKNKIESDFLKDGGVTTTLNFTGQQWDAPNGWAPLQWIAIKGLRNYGYNKLADKIKDRWLSLNEKVFRQTGKMFEKYNVYDISLHAGGGEYPLQDGFGWTNGIASALLKNLDEQG